MDAANQTATDEVRVFVKAAESAPMVADAGKNVTITLPLNEVELDGSASKGSGSLIKTWNWTQVRYNVSLVDELRVLIRTGLFEFLNTILCSDR
jgi:hypothetical protein